MVYNDVGTADHRQSVQHKLYIWLGTPFLDIHIFNLTPTYRCRAHQQCQIQCKITIHRWEEKKCTELKLTQFLKKINFKILLCNRKINKNIDFLLLQKINLSNQKIRSNMKNSNSAQKIQLEKNPIGKRNAKINSKTVRKARKPNKNLIRCGS